MLKKSPLIISILLASNIALANGDTNLPIIPTSNFLDNCFGEGQSCDVLIKKGMSDAYPLVRKTQDENYHNNTIKNTNLPKLRDLVNQEFQTFDTIDKPIQFI